MQIIYPPTARLYFAMLITAISIFCAFDKQQPEVIRPQAKHTFTRTMSAIVRSMIIAVDQAFSSV